MSDFVTIANKVYTYNTTGGLAGKTTVQFDLYFGASTISGSKISGATLDLIYQYNLVTLASVTSPKFSYTDPLTGELVENVSVWSNVYKNLATADTPSPSGSITLVADFNTENPIVAADNKVLTVKLYVTGNITDFAVELQKKAIGGVNYLTLNDGTALGAKQELDGGTYVILPASLADVVVDLMPGSDSGTLATDDITNVITPVVTVNLTGKTLTEGHILQVIDTSHSNAVVGTYTISAQDVTSGLASKDITLSTLSGGTYTLKAQFSTSSGTIGTASTTATTVTVDTTVPTTIISGLSLSADTGTSATDFITNTAVQTISGMLSAALGTGEKLYGSVDNGTTWVDITSKVSSTALSWDGATLSGSSTIKLEVRDASGNTATAASQAYELDTSVPNLHAPVFISGSTGSVDEDAAISTVIYTAATTDADNPVTPPVYTLSGADAGLLNISSAGAVTLKALADYEAKPSYSFEVIANDGANTTTKAVVVSVNNLNDNSPVFTSAATGSVDENAAPSTVIYTAATTDADNLAARTYTLGGTDAALLNITSAGVVTLKSSADYEAKPSYSFDVIASDGLHTASQAVVVSVNNLNDTTPPTVPDFVTIANKVYTYNTTGGLAGKTTVQFDLYFGASTISGSKISGATLDLIYQYNLVTLASVTSPKFSYTDPLTGELVENVSVWSNVYKNLATADTPSPSGSITLVADFNTENPIVAADNKVLTVKLYVTGNITDFAVELQKKAIGGVNYLTLNDGTALGAKQELDGGTYVILPASLADVVVDLMPGSDSGTLATDDITNVITPVVTVNLTGKTLTEGHILQVIDTSHSNAVVGTYTISAQDVTSGLASKDITLSTLSGGTYTLKAQFSTSSGTIGTASTTATTVTVDTTVPTTIISGLSLSADTGTSATDFITNTAVQTISGMLSAALGTGEKLYGSVDNGTTWVDITSKVSSTALSWDGVTLSGSSTIKLEVRDTAGNAATAVSQSYVLDTANNPNPPTPALVLKSVETGTGVDVQIWLTAGTAIDTADLDLSYDATKVNYTGAVSNPALAGWQWIPNLDPASPGHLLIAAMSTDFSSINNSTSDTLLETISFTLVPGTDVFIVSLVSGTGLAIGDQPVETGQLPTLPIIVLPEEDTSAPSVSTVTDTTVVSVTKDAISFTVTFDEAVVGIVGTGSFSATNGTVSSVTSAGGNAYTVVVTPAAGVASGNVALSLVGTGLTDAAGNTVVSADLSVKDSQSIDTLAPSVSTVTDTTAAIVTKDAISFTVTFGEAVIGTVGTGSFSATNGTVSSVTSAGGNAYTVVVSPTAGIASGNVVLSLVGTGLKDAAGNTVVSADLSGKDSQNIDTLAPSVSTVTDTTAASVTKDAISFTVTFGEAVVGTVGTGSFTASNGTVSSVTPAGGNAYTVVVTPTAGVASGNVALILVGTGLTDTAGNMVVSTGLSGKDSQGIDTLAPSVSTVTDTTAAIVTKDPISFTVTFGEAVVGTVGTSSFTATNGTVSSVTPAGGNSYTVVVTPTAGVAIGNVALSLVGTGLTDVTGNAVVSAGLSGKDTQGIDTLAPTTTLSVLHLSADTGTSNSDFITKTAAQTISGTLSSVTVAGDVVKVSMDNGATWTTATNTIGQNSFNLAGVTLTGSNKLKVQVEDAAGNAGAPTSQAYVLDTVAPNTTISGLHLSADTGISNTDFITDTASQTVTGTLSAALGAGESLFGSLNNGLTWQNITSKVSGTAISWDGATLTGSSMIKLEVRDVAGNAVIAASQAYELTVVQNSYAPVFTSGSTGSVAENAEASTVIYTAGTTDADNPAIPPVYTLSGTDADLLNITTAGMVTLKASADYESVQKSYSFNVIASDGEPTHNATQAVVVSVTNLNDNAPVFTSGSTGSVNENASTSTVIYTAGTTDADGGTRSYTLSGADAALLNITSAGVVILKASANYEEKTSYSFNVVAHDSLVTDTSDHSVSQAVVVSVTNLNDNAPVFTSGSTGSVDENASINTVVYAAVTTDADNPAIPPSYTLSGTDASLLNITSTGLVTLKATSNYEVKTSYSFNVIANDGLNSTTKAVLVSVNNLNDTTPAVTSAALTNDTTPLVSGTADAGSTVTAVIAGATYTTTAIGGTWSIDTGSTTPTSGSLGLNVNGSNSVSVTSRDAAGNTLSAVTQTLVIDTLAPTTAITTGSLKLSADTGIPDDFITSTASQTISATLSAALITGEALYGSVDNGLSWKNITSKVSGTSISWNAATLLAGTNFIKFELRDAAGNAGTAVIREYTLDETVHLNHLPTGGVIINGIINGTLESGQTLTADTKTLADADGIGTLSYQWKAGGEVISGAVNRTYMLTSDEVGKTMSVAVSYIDGYKTLEKIASSETVAVILPQNHLPTGTVSIFGDATQYETLIAAYALSDADGINSDTINYQWKANGINIGNATTNSELTLDQSQVGKNISVVVSYTDLKNNHESVESGLTAAVVNINDAPTGLITIVGDALKGTELSASNTFQDLDGISGGFLYQWKADGVNIFGATDQYYTLTISEVGKKITVTASYTDDYGNKESVVSDPTLVIRDTTNNPATGLVTINGTATQNKTLIANYSITDPDGVGGSTFAFQWQADGVNIAGATARTYQLKESEVGKTVAVYVSFDDDEGNFEDFLSSETRAVVNVNDAPGGTVTIDGTAAEDQTLSVNTTALKDPDGLGALSYQWKADGSSIAGATKSDYTLTQAEVAKKITVQLSYTDGHGTLENNVLSAETAAVANVNDLPRIQEGQKLIVADGGVIVGEKLGVNTGFLIDEDGPDVLVITSYQWKADGKAIVGATDPQLILTAAQTNQTITVTVTYTDDFGISESYTSEPSVAVANNSEKPDGSVSLDGTAKQNETLTATVIDLDGTPNPISYQWRVNMGTDALPKWADITGATGKTFVLTEAQVGKQVQVAVSYIDDLSVAENPASSATGIVDNVNDPLSGSVTIQGTATQGETLVAGNTLADPDGIPSGAIHYQWTAGGVNISGAIDSSYTLKQAEVGKTITVVASYTDGHGTAEHVESVATTAVININDTPTGTVNIAGIGQQGEMLQASHTLADADGIPAGAIQYQWQADGKDIDGAIGESYVVKQAEVGKAMTVTASYTDTQGTDESVISAATSPMLNINDFPTGLVTITGTAKQGQLLTANTAALADADGLGTLNYQWQANGKIISGATNSTYILTQAEVDKAITVKVFYTDLFGQPESVRSTPPTAKVVNINDLPTGSVTVSGIFKQGELLTATNNLADPDGPPALAISYQWQADNVVIDGAEDSTYVLTQEEVGKRITVVAKYTDTYRTDESVASEATSVIENKNDAPTGTVTIEGTTRQGESLAAHTTALADADGLGGLSYQWSVNTGTTALPVWTSIDGATYSVFTLTGNEVGKTVAVKVSYTDNYDYAESVLSRPTQKISNTNDAPTGTVTITGTAQQGKTLTVSNNLVDPDGPPVLPITWQWQADGVDIEGYTGSTLVLEEAQVAKKITVIAIYDDAGGTTEHVYSGATAVVENVDDRYTGSLRINGTAKEKETLTAVSTIDDADGMGELSYQWSVVTRTISGTDVWTVIAGATAKTFVLTETQVGKKVGVTASYTDRYGYRDPNPVLSNITASVKNWNSSPTGDVTLSGLVKVGKTLAADNTLADDDGMGAISYQWYADDGAIENATESSFKLTRNEVGKLISVKVSYIDGHGYNEIKESAKTVPVTKIYTLSAHDGYLVNALVWIDDNANKQLDWKDQNLNGKWDKGEGESWALTDSSGQVTGLEGDGTILITANPKGGTFDMSTGNAFTGSFAAPSDAKVVSTLTTLVVAAMAANSESEAAAETRVRAALGLDASVIIIDYDPLAEASKTAATLTGKQIAINVESATIQVNNIIDVAVSVANAVYDKAVADKAETDPYWTGRIVQVVGIIADQLLGEAQAGKVINLADATVIANIITETLAEAVAKTYLPEGYIPSPVVITAIADALAKANKNIVAIDNDATGEDAPASIKEIIQAQIVAQNTIVADAYMAVYGNSVTEINANSANFNTLYQDAADQVATIFINHTPVGNVAINGVVMPGETLTATNSLVDIEGLGIIGYQWYRGVDPIINANHETYALNIADIGKSITVKASYIDGAGYSESMSSDPTTVVPDVPTSLSDVKVVAASITNDTTPTVTVDLTHKVLEVGDIIQIIDSNHDNAVVASETVTEIGAGVTLKYIIDLLSLVDDTHALKVQLVDGSTGNAGLSSNTVTTVKVDTTLPVITDPLFKSGVVTAVFDAPLETGEVLSGSVDDGLTWADITTKVTGTAINWDVLSGADSTKLQLKIQDAAGNQNIVDVQPGTGIGYDLTVHAKFWNNDKPISGVTVDTGILTNNLGVAVINNVPSGTKTLTPSLTVSQADSNAIGIGDAIGVLKSIVGLTTFNSYQAIAADFDKSGSVGIGDAIGILKHIVGLPSAPTPEWDFVDKTVLTPHPADPISVTIGANTTVELIGILLGDVDGSAWSNL